VSAGYLGGSGRGGEGPTQPQPHTHAPQQGLSLQTLVIAAIASATAAVVTSLFWSNGTVVSAALTPVIVSLVREGLQKPARHIANVGTGRLGEAVKPTKLAPVTAGKSWFDRLRDWRPFTSKRIFDAPYSRIYGRRRLRTALVTGGLAFLLAAIVLTVGELAFGGSVAGGDNTTLFGGRASSQIPKSPSEPNTQTPGSSTSGNGQSNTGSSGEGSSSQTPPSSTSQSSPSQGQGGGTPQPSPSPKKPGVQSTPSAPNTGSTTPSSPGDTSTTP
jgi:hypothetical protein